ncbi:MAG: LysM peptidoglycan-binding domain-containing protein [Nocardiopsaceae bacterium]|nr:LysM peptidoglycan-binding domain-containing protein [Nocardiopsaceae bacterium]
MGITSAAEAKLDARIRPEITVMRSRTSYPRRARGRAVRKPALTVLPGGADAGEASRPVREGASRAGDTPLQDESVRARAAAVERPVQKQAAARLERVGEAERGPARRAAASGPAANGQVRRAPASGHVRLTRRGRIVVGALAGLVAAGLAALIWLAVAGQAEAAGPGALSRGSGSGHTMLRVVVHPGETLWSIAVRTDPTADPRDIVQQIIDDNALRGPSIQAGQVLWVPRV